MEDKLKVSVLAVGELQTNCYLIGSGDGSGDVLIVDPGDSGHEIAEYLKMKGLHPLAILLTHGHHDHIMGVNELVSDIPDLPVYIGEKERRMVEDPGINCGFLGNTYTISPDVYVKAGDELEFLNRKIQVLETPGHTEGSVCYYFPEDSALFAGDTLFFGSYGRTDLPTGSETDLWKSLEYLLTTLPEETDVFPGHGPGTTIGREKLVEGFS